MVIVVLVGCVDGVQRICCARMVAIFHIETLVTFNLTPLLFHAESDLDQIIWIFGHNLVDGWATKLYK